MDTLADSMNKKYGTKLSKSSISRWENGDADPKLDYVRLLADYFGVKGQYFIPQFLEDIGDAIKYERKSRKLSLAEVANDLKISEVKLKNFEEDIEPIDEYHFGKLLDLFGLGYYEFLQKHELYDEYIPKHFEGDVEKYEAFKKACDEDAERETAITYHFNKLNNYGKDEAIKRVTEMTKINEYTEQEQPETILNAAHARAGATKEDMQHDDDIMDDENF